MSHLTAKHSKPLDPVLMILAALGLAIALTWIVPSGTFQRSADGTAKPGTYHVIDKDRSISALLMEPPTAGKASAASPLAFVTAIPAGMAKTSGLIVMILFLGGMFGVLKATGALEEAVEKLVAATRGNVAIAVPLLMLAISAGGAFLGLISEYLLIIPIVLALSARLGRDSLFGFAIVAVAAKIGYLGSVTNPVVLVVAQPLAGVPAFSGLGVRLAIWLVAMVIGVAFVLRGTASAAPTVAVEATPPLGARHISIIAVLALSVALVVYGSAHWHWREVQFGALYCGLAIVVGILGGLRPKTISSTFVDGMKSMVLAGLLVGLAGAVEVVLTDGKILDSIVQGLASCTSGLPRVLVGEALMATEMILTFLIPSASAKAAVSMPILTPIAHLSGISGQTTVLAFLLGNGLVNLISPTSGMLLAYLATASLSYGTWFRYILKLFLILTALSAVALALAVLLGY